MSIIISIFCCYVLPVQLLRNNKRHTYTFEIKCCLFCFTLEGGTPQHRLSVYSLFSGRVGLPLDNIISPFLPVMDVFSVDLKFCHIRFYTLQHVLLGCPTGLQLYTPYISSPSTHHFSLSHIHTISVYSLTAGCNK